jgi:hypothetical protein
MEQIDPLMGKTSYLPYPLLDRCIWNAAIPQQSTISSIPYVFLMLADDSAGIGLLPDMDLIDLGGAALPQSVGDLLVSKAVNIVCHSGSAKCRFPLSSHCPYESDKSW